jgi:hypothetical protein
MAGETDSPAGRRRFTIWRSDLWRPVQAKSARQEHGHLSASNWRIGAVVAATAAAGDS